MDFIDYLKRGEFRIAVCRSCKAKAWPPSMHCPRCLSETSLQKTVATGTLVEFTKSHVRDREGIFGVVEMSGFKLVGSFADNDNLREGMKVKMTRCGVRPDGTAFYCFEPAEMKA